ncbi:MAG: nuclear transport factor 2 family protein [Gammaproteobacteria bacterium]|nr:nuclear transport factor 2 family protein [Gammaproteobacteria bacterium]MCP5442345.1 nuclear transport factor 2 family protein [Chromatiaceae bacterium]
MKTSKLTLKSPDEVEAVFYEAFIHCDPEVMAGLWADEDVICVHPGSGAILDYRSIVRSWVNIFSDVRRTELKYTVINAVSANDLAVHVVAEEMLSSGMVTAIVLATNVYRKFNAGWLMIEHHASLMQSLSNGQTLQ